MTKSSCVGPLLARAQKELEIAGSDEPQANAQFLLAAVLAKSRTWVLMNADAVVSAEEELELAGLVLRKAKGEPLSYILGTQPFCGLDISVSPAVLTPRPETEDLVRYAAAYFQQKEPRLILDLCTGSGCIALALAARFAQATVMAVDLCAGALAVARQNAQKLGFEKQIVFVQGNMWAPVTGKFDLIISNPPYIASADLPGLTQEVQHEPQLALDGGPDGLDLFRPIAARAAQFVNSGGILAVELGKDQPKTAALMLDGAQWRWCIKKDIFGIERFLIAQKI